MISCKMPDQAITKVKNQKEEYIMKLNFSSNEVRTIFAENDYAEYSQLMFDTAMGEEKVSTKDANDKIREIMFSVLGVDENCTRKELRKTRTRNVVFR